MNAAQIHLALNHLPLFLSITGSGIMVWGMIKKNESIKMLSLYFLVAAAVFTAPVYLTGEGTEEIVEHLPGANDNAIERHEEMAKISLITIIITGCLALAGLLLRKIRAFKLYLVAVMILSLATFGIIAQTAHLGGLIRHSELQNKVDPVIENNEKESGEKD